MKKFILLSIVALASFVTLNGQILTNGVSSPNIPGENAFIDASFSFSADSKKGKGLIFPTVNLVEFEFIIDGYAADDMNFLHFFDGMLVYNNADGETITSGNRSSTITKVVPGFYYYSNPKGREAYEVNWITKEGVAAGKWVAFGSGGTPLPADWNDATIPAEGSIPSTSTVISVNITDKNCGTSGAYTCVYEIEGGATGIAENVDPNNGKFKVNVPANGNASSRKVTITVISPCGTKKIYVYTQAGTAPCPTLTQPGAITFGARPTTIGGTFTASVAAVTDANSYTWTVPSGMTITSGSGSRTITITVNNAGSYNTNAISVIAKNTCGNSSTSRAGANGVFMVTNPDGSYIEKIGNNDYKVYDYGSGIGTWMVENSKEGTSSAQSYPSQGTNGYYYTWAQAAGACPSGWHLPSQAEWNSLVTWVNNNKTSEGAKFWITDAGAAFAGYRDGNGTWHIWGSIGYWWGASYGLYGSGHAGGMSSSTNTTSPFLFSVRCVKN